MCLLDDPENLVGYPWRYVTRAWTVIISSERGQGSSDIQGRRPALSVLAACLLGLVYGHQIEDRDDELVHAADGC